MTMQEGNILEVSNLTVRFHLREGTVNAVNGASFVVPKGKSIGIVGESGCGKTLSAYSITRLLPSNAQVSGEIHYRCADGRVVDILRLPAGGRDIRQIRGKEIAMIFQEPMSSLSPVHTIYNQISEPLILFQKLSEKQARQRTAELLKLVGIPKAERRLDEYPFQFSGGMRQRVMIAMALARNPRLLIADEPTTALDVTLQAQVLDLIQNMQNEFNLSLILITHDLGVVAHMVDYVFIMYLGQVVESGPVTEIFDHPQHPYTQGLLASIPKLQGNRGQRITSIPGSVPSPYNIPPGCLFAPRCPFVFEECHNARPGVTQVGASHSVYCYLCDGKEGRDAANA